MKKTLITYIRNTIALRIVLLLIPLQLATLITYSQTISQTDTNKICFTVQQARTIYKDVKLGEVCDSIKMQQAEQIDVLNLIILNKNKVVKVQGDRVEVLNRNLTIANKKLAIANKFVVYGIPVGFGLGVAATILLK